MNDMGFSNVILCEKKSCKKNDWMDAEMFGENLKDGWKGLFLKGLYKQY